MRAWAPAGDVGPVLAVAAHPDDVDFGSGGTIGALTAAGVEVAYCIVTDGEAGGTERSMPRDEMARLRRDEQRAAAAAVGVRDVHFLGYPDGCVVTSWELRRDLSRVIRRVRPRRVISPSPERAWDRIFASHPDHLAVGEATVCAVYPDARNPFAHPELLDREGLEPHVVEELWLAGGPDPDLVVEVTATFDRKIAALRCHRSQVGDGHDLEPRLRRWAAETAARAGLGAGSLAEVYRSVAVG